MYFVVWKLQPTLVDASDRAIYFLLPSSLIHSRPGTQCNQSIHAIDVHAARRTCACTVVRSLEFCDNLFPRLCVALAGRAQLHVFIFGMHVNAITGFSFYPTQSNVLHLLLHALPAPYCGQRTIKHSRNTRKKNRTNEQTMTNIIIIMIVNGAAQTFGLQLDFCTIFCVPISLFIYYFVCQRAGWMVRRNCICRQQQWHTLAFDKPSANTHHNSTAPHKCSPMSHTYILHTHKYINQKNCSNKKFKWSGECTKIHGAVAILE